MMNQVFKKKNYFWLIFLLGFIGSAEQTPQIEHQPLHYDIQVNAHIIPIYAVDETGNPVYDLKAEEIQLYINKKSFKSFNFISYHVVEEEKDVETGEIKREKEKAGTRKTQGRKKVEKAERNTQKKAPERINFIIIDVISNSKSGVRNAKKLAISLVQSGGTGDSFVLLQVTPRAGFKHIIGPEKDKAKLLQALDEVYKNPDWAVLVPRGKDLPPEVNMMSIHEEYDLKLDYRRELSRFSRSFRELKYALKTIRFPKTVFLISGGIQEIVIDHSELGLATGYYQSQQHILCFY